MTGYLVSLLMGLAVGAAYGLVQVRSPAPPMIALVGLIGCPPAPRFQRGAYQPIIPPGEAGQTPPIRTSPTTALSQMRSPMGTWPKAALGRPRPFASFPESRPSAMSLARP